MSEHSAVMEEQKLPGIEAVLAGTPAGARVLHHEAELHRLVGLQPNDQPVRADRAGAAVTHGPAFPLPKASLPPGPTTGLAADPVSVRAAAVDVLRLHLIRAGVDADRFDLRG